MVNTRHIEKNGLSFECPDYYDIGKYPSSDEAHKSMVALSKHDRKCELYITVYRKNKFDNNAKRNTALLKSYLQLQNYKNVSINKKLPYCFNATVSHHMGNIKTTIVYDFNHGDNVIMIVGNLMPSSNYDCIGDIKIILDSLQYDNSTVKQIKRKITSKNKTIIGLISFAINIAALIFIPNTLNNVIFTVFGLIPAIFLLLPENFKSSKVLSIISLFICIPMLAFFSYFFWAFFLFELDMGIWNTLNIHMIDFSLVLLWLFNICCALLLYVYTGHDNSNNSDVCSFCGHDLKEEDKYCSNCGEKINGVKENSLKNELFCWYDEKYGYRLSKTKIISLCVFMVSGIIAAISFLINSVRIIDLLDAVLIFIVVGLIFSVPVLIIGTMIKKSNENFGKKDAQLKHVLFYCENNDDGFRFSKTKIISLSAFIISGLIAAISYTLDPTVDFMLLSAFFIFVFVGSIVGGILFLIGMAFHHFANGYDDNSI